MSKRAKIEQFRPLIEAYKSDGTVLLKQDIISKIEKYFNNVNQLANIDHRIYLLYKDSVLEQLFFQVTEKIYKDALNGVVNEGPLKQIGTLIVPMIKEYLDILTTEASGHRVATVNMTKLNEFHEKINQAMYNTMLTDISIMKWMFIIFVENYHCEDLQDLLFNYNILFSS
jgi:hypothetical protein